MVSGLIYWALLNIENHQKYSLTALQLYAVVKVKALRNSKSVIVFQNLIDGLKKLDNGLLLNINGNNTKYFGIMAMGLGDTPALNWLGGFKESVSKTIKFCRNCEISRGTDFCNYIIVPRCSELHKRRLYVMENAKTLEKRNEHSKKFGINNSSILSNIPNFNVCSSLLQDPMHVLYEGICHLELQCLFEKILFVQKIIDLDFLNNKIKKFDYPPRDRSDIPNVIEKKNIEDSKFCQTAGQLSTLYQNLPLMIGDKLIGNKYWANFLRLLNIINLTFAFCFNDRTVEELDKEIKNYLSNFSALYPDKIMIPKMHFMCHFPLQLKNYGLLRFHSTFRFKAKNGLIKSFNFNLSFKI